MTRDELIEAGARALEADHTNRAPGDAWQILAPMAASVVDAVEPLIRADERERTNTVGGHRQIREEGRADMCNDLRAQVEALPVIGVEFADHIHRGMIQRDRVLALFDGGTP